VTARDQGFAAGMDYQVTPNTAWGFALGGGSLNWNLASGLGGGRSDEFQMGLHGTTRMGPAYLSAALAFANNWFTTNRVAIGDQLTAGFVGQSYAARVEARLSLRHAGESRHRRDYALRGFAGATVAHAEL
jgi:uncharacterized protein with beta-barrel porin domain